MNAELIQFLMVAGAIFGGGLWLKRRVERGGTAGTPAPPETRSSGASSVPATFGKARRRPAPEVAAAAAVDAMAEEWRRQAAEKDDRHKAELRSHVDRTPPPPTEEGREAIERARKAWLAIRHVFPPRLPQRSMSYVGGLPIVPDEFDWPTVHNRKGLLERLTFMAQVDCSDLPAGPNRDLLPKAGFLYFFAPMSDSFGPDACHFVCRYESGPVGKSWTPLDMPFVSTFEQDDRIEAAWRGKRTHYDKVEIELDWIEEPSDAEVTARGAEGHAFEVAAIIEQEKSDAFFGPSRSANAMFLVSRAPRDALWIPYEGFPLNLKTIRILEQLVLAYQREESADVAERMEKLSPEASDEAQRLSELKSELTMFGMSVTSAFFHSYSLKDHDPVPEDVKARVLDFLERLRMKGMPSSKVRRYAHLTLPAVINDWIASAAIHGAEAGLLDEASAKLIPSEVVAALADRHQPRSHRMLGKGDLVQVAAEDMKDRYILLLQLGPDPALNWTIGEMGPLQYWITPEDLAAENFKNVVLTIEAY